MKISELSERSGIPIPTIKFYIREGLLPPGDRTSQNQAQYGDAHVALLSLIRTLKDDLGMSVSTISRVLATDPRRGADFLEEGLAAIAKSRAGERKVDEKSAEYEESRRLARQLFKQAGWSPSESDAYSEDAIVALTTIRRVWPDAFRLEYMLPYAKVANELAQIEIPEDWNPEADPVEAFKYAVLGTYLFEPLLLALRRVAEAERSRKLSGQRPKQPRKVAKK